MKPDPTNLLKIAGIQTPLIGFYDVPDPKPFEPFAEPKRCYFEHYDQWQQGYSTCAPKNGTGCRGGCYWVGGVEFASRSEFARTLNQREGFKSSDELMAQWLENQKPYEMEHEYVVIGPLKEGQDKHLKTVTFYVNPDQLSLLILGAEYNNASIDHHPVIAPFGSGCGQMAAVFGDLDAGTPKAVIGATDIAMRQHLPPGLLAFTVNKPMFRQLCGLGKSSFLYKSFWKRLRKARGKGF